VVIIADITADQIEAIARLHHHAGATVRVSNQGRGVSTVTAQYPNPPVGLRDAGAASEAQTVAQAALASGASITGPVANTISEHELANKAAAAERDGGWPTMSKMAIALIKSFERCMMADGAGCFVPYRCPGGILTIGWGHTNSYGRRFDDLSVWSQRECDEAFVDDMNYFCIVVRGLVRVNLNQNQFDALVSFAYNCGAKALAQSALLKKLNDEGYAAAAAEFPRWNKCGGLTLQALTRRRAAEMELFMSAPCVSFTQGGQMSRAVTAS
jgi:lysozyme